MLQAVPYLDPRIRGDDGRSRTIVIPAQAGIQSGAKLELAIRPSSLLDSGYPDPVYPVPDAGPE